MSKLNPTDSQVSNFANTIIGQDGVIILRLLSEISSDIHARDTIVNIWHFHHKQIPPIYGPGDEVNVLTTMYNILELNYIILVNREENKVTLMTG